MLKQRMQDIKNAMERFSFAQLTSNSDGKTSGSGTMGILICTIGCITFFLGCLDKMFISHDIDILTQTIIFTGIGAALLGYRKSVDKHQLSDSEDIDVTDKEL
jgi:hypothetical protein